MRAVGYLAFPPARAVLTTVRTVTVFGPLTLVGVVGCSSSSVDPVTVDAVVVAPSTLQIVSGGTAQLAAQIVDARGVTFLGPRLVWSSDAPDVATVSPTGLVTAGDPGVAVISAEADGVTGSSRVTVIDLPQIALTPSSLIFAATVGGGDPAPQTVSVSNAGDGPLEALSAGTVTFGAGQPSGWLTMALTESPAALSVRVTVGTLAAGSYTASIPVQARNAASVSLGVTLSVSP